MSGKAAAQKRNENKKLLEELKAFCPVHRHKDLESLIKKEKGDRDKISAQISEWYMEPVPTAAEEWADVSKKPTKKQQQRKTSKDNRGEGRRDNREHVGGRGYGRSGDRGGRAYGRGSAGGRGGGPDRRVRGRGERDAARREAAGNSPAPVAAAPAVEKKEVAPKPAAPALVKPVTARPLQGAWGARAAAAVAPPASAPEPVPAAEPVVEEAPFIVEETPEPVLEEPTVDVGVVSAQDPTPSGIITEDVAPPAPKPIAATGGNVWGTKGGAHLIQAEKKPVIPETPPAPVVEETPFIDEPLLPPPEEDVIAPVESVDQLSASGWASGAADTVGPISVDAPLLDPTPVVEEPVVPEPVAPVETATLKPTSVLNMGHWDKEEDSVNHDFGFGFDNDHSSVDETTISSSTNNVTAAVSEAAPSVSPARPPPGLGLGMPPMPEKIVSVSELENKLDNTTLNKEEEPKQAESALPAQQTAPATTNPPEGFAANYPPQQNYGQYGMGMYNYNAPQPGVGAPNGFMMGGRVPQGISPAPLGGAPPQQKQQTAGIPQQQGIYGGAQSTDAPASTDANSNSNAEMPPGMANIHYNPAFAMYGQQPYQMGQAHLGGYGFGFPGQYGGYGGYGQAMGPGAGYGQPYDDQAQHHGGNNHQGGYNNKNSGGGYRGRNNQHNNQYQNQYNSQGQQYGGQPYNMGYNDHFNQRGGYGQQPMDPYMQNSGYQQENEHGKGNKNKGNNRNNFGNNNQNVQHQQGGQFGGRQNNGADSQTFQGW